MGTRPDDDTLAEWVGEVPYGRDTEPAVLRLVGEIGRAREAEDALRSQRDAALEALRPFARIGAHLVAAQKLPGRRPISPVLMSWCLVPGSPEVELAFSDCLSALKTWKEYRGEEEP